MRAMRRISSSVVVLALGLGAVACGQSHAKHVPAGNDPYSRVAAAELDAPCQAVPDAGPVPAASAAVETTGATDEAEVVAYFPHPYDEAFFTAGTLTKLGEGGHKTVVVLMSHGEGGRVLEVNTKGEFVEHYDLPKDQIVQTRDRETDKAAHAMQVETVHMYAGSDNADFGKTLSCEETLEKWEQSLPGGVANVLHKLVDDIRTRRPRVVITSDPRDEGGWFEHGHNKAFGALVELAARMAADPRVTSNENPHVVQELLTVAPSNVKPDVSITVGEGARRKVLSLYPSQFRYDKVEDTSGRKVEDYAVVWRAKGVTVPPAGSILGDLVAHPKK